MSEDLVITLILGGLLAAALFGRALRGGRGLPRPDPARPSPTAKPVKPPSCAEKRAAAAVNAALQRAKVGEDGPVVVSLLQALLTESRAAATPPGGARVVDHVGAHQGYALGDWAEKSPYLHVFPREPAGGVEADLILSYGVKGQVFGYAAVIVEMRRDRRGRPSDRATAVASARETALAKAGYATLAFDPADVAADAADCARACLTPVRALIGEALTA